MRRKKGGRVGTLIFLLPTAVIIAIVLVGLLYNTGSGTLVVEAVVEYGSTSIPIGASASVAGVTRSTPFNLSLSQGPYQVTYSPITWYRNATARQVSVLGGKTAFAIGVYVPITRVVAVDQNGFNASSIRVGHGITPVVWLNSGPSALTLVSSVFTVTIAAGANFTHIFQNVSSVSVSTFGTSTAMTVDSV